ncbi:hypothetical protein L226DRAFT_537179 [Lentinus tigrinus ALCF2SS1-7]|uniref:uncharacterized protein n=1 Tax=Lentinus tigrinus ALCF2SS1-7 TaxID=1328758 RepID=UPI001165CB98|nr:hypothetical protein L226DRAFT_537179 [Lentinus tigrinus ALCF2SS1-7]
MEDISSSSPPSYASLPRDTRTSRRGSAHYHSAPIPTWSDTRCESSLRPDGPFVKNTPPRISRSSTRGPATPRREPTRTPRLTVHSLSTASSTPLRLEEGATSPYLTYRSRFESTFDKDTLEHCAFTVFGLCCAAPTYSILVQSIGLWIFRPDVAPWVSLKISALILPAIFGGFVLTVVFFVPFLFLTVWVDAIKWNVPYVFILANMPIVVATAILPSSSMLAGFTVAHAAQLSLWGLIPPVLVAGVVGCVGLVGAGLVACGVCH